MKIVMFVVSFVTLGVVAPQLTAQYYPFATLEGGSNGYSCENSLGTRCIFPTNNSAYEAGMPCNTVGQHGTFCTEDVDPTSCTVAFWSNCYTATPSTCPSIDVICAQDPYSGDKSYESSGAGSPGCGTVTRCE